MTTKLYKILPFGIQVITCQKYCKHLGMVNATILCDIHRDPSNHMQNIFQLVFYQNLVQHHALLIIRTASTAPAVAILALMMVQLRVVMFHQICVHIQWYVIAYDDINKTITTLKSVLPSLHRTTVYQKTAKNDQFGGNYPHLFTPQEC